MEGGEILESNGKSQYNSNIKHLQLRKFTVTHMYRLLSVISTKYMQVKFMIIIKSPQCGTIFMDSDKMTR